MHVTRCPPFSVSISQVSSKALGRELRNSNNLTMREAAALPLIFITAWEGLVDRASVRAAQKVLVQGGAGGVGG
jgi:NADPH:quinone reductase-like Zn-dependent oxidoreductase